MSLFTYAPTVCSLQYSYYVSLDKKKQIKTNFDLFDRVSKANDFNLTQN